MTPRYSLFVPGGLSKTAGPLGVLGAVGRGAWGQVSKGLSAAKGAFTAARQGALKGPMGAMGPAMPGSGIGASLGKGWGAFREAPGAMKGLRTLGTGAGLAAGVGGAGYLAGRASAPDPSLGAAIGRSIGGMRNSIGM